MVAGQTVLLIDDDPDQLLLFGTLISSGGYQVASASSGEDGLRLMENCEVALVVCDMMMPGMDGSGFVSRMREIERFSDIPVIILTAGRDDLERESYESGADAFCLKVDARKRLMSQIQELLSSPKT